MICNRNVALCALLALGASGGNFAYGQVADNSLREVSQTALTTDNFPVIPSRIVQPIDETKLVKLQGNTHPLARGEFDKGAVDPQLPMERMLLLLRRSPEQETALEEFMARQLDPASPDFHHWLDPVEFGKRYGPSDADLAAVTNWLQNLGFTVDEVTNGRTFIQFSGTAGLVQKAFNTEIHNYNVKGVQHIANNADPSIPEALSPVVAGVVSLHNFFLEPMHFNLGSFRQDSKIGKWTPENEDVITKPLFGVATSGGTFELVSPYDFATIYNVLPLWNAGIDGTGQTIAIAGRSDISLTDVATFRSAFGLPAKAPTIITNGADPGVPSEDDKIENTLDVEWSGAVAKGATVKFVTTKSTSTTDGAVVSAQYIIDNKVAPIMSFSYGNCELAIGTTGNEADNSMWQQGAAEGITEFVASGDQGSAACDGGQTAPYGAEKGLAVSGSSSTPYDVAVGGTDFSWANSTKAYWSKTNGTNDLSALGYIPEVPWNGTCASVDVDTLIGAIGAGLDEEETCQYLLNNSVDLDLVNVTGGTGGKSACTAPTSTTVASCAGGYAKPSWQTGTGVPADGKRDVPDLSLFASSGALDTAYVICDSQIGPCTFSVASDALAQGVGGTSVASPSMAGIMALVLQQIGGTAQGLPNSVFYQLAAKDNLTSCKSNTVAGGNSCIFYDVTTDNNSVPCVPGDPNCTVLHSGDTVGILNGITSSVGYDAGTGYDLATGLGSVNAYNLAHAWPVAAAPTVTLTPATMTFASTTEGTTSAAQVATLKNTGTVALSIASGGITIAGTDASSYIKTTTCGTTLAAGATCTISVSFKPAATGTLTATLEVADNATGSPQKVALTGTGAAASTLSITLSPTTLSFPNTASGATSDAQLVTVKNTGTATVTLSSISITGTNPTSFLELNNCGASLVSGASCTVFVAFKPASAAALKATLSIADTATGSPQTVALSGTGTAVDSVTLSTKSLTFPSTAKGTTSEAQSVTLTNAGTSILDITGISITGTGATSFTQLNTCGPTLAPAANCVVYVAFKPATTGTITASLSIADNGSASPQTVTLSGTGH